MGSLDNLRERFEALEQQTAQLQHQIHALEAHTRTVSNGGCAGGWVCPVGWAF